MTILFCMVSHTATKYSYFQSAKQAVYCLHLELHIFYRSCCCMYVFSCFKSFSLKKVKVLYVGMVLLFISSSGINLCPVGARRRARWIHPSPGAPCKELHWFSQVRLPLPPYILTSKEYFKKLLYKFSWVISELPACPVFSVMDCNILEKLMSLLRDNLFFIYNNWISFRVQIKAVKMLRHCLKHFTIIWGYF